MQLYFCVVFCVVYISMQLCLCPLSTNCSTLLNTGGAIELTLTGVDANSNSNSTDCNTTNTSGSNSGG